MLDPQTLAWDDFKLVRLIAEAKGLAGAAERGLVQLKGHRSVGGMRASLYNAMPIEGVKALINYMADFALSRG